MKKLSLMQPVICTPTDREVAIEEQEETPVEVEEEETILKL